jgi:hypothetical protein
MNTFAAQNLVKCAALVALFLGLNARAEDKPAATAKAACMTPQSVFVNDPTIGVDPFFPTSKRRLDELPRSTMTNVVVQTSTIWDRLKLQGMSGPEGQRLALISGATVAVSEIAEIKCEGRIVKIRCVEIRDRSVVLQLVASGETREIKLRDNI